MIAIADEAKRVAGATKFADMPEGSRNGWVLWAQSHQWTADPFNPYYDEMTGELVTFADERDASGNWRAVEARHATPRAMKDWAGY